LGFFVCFFFRRNSPNSLKILVGYLESGIMQTPAFVEVHNMTKD